VFPVARYFISLGFLSETACPALPARPPPATLAPRAGCPPRPVASRGPARRVGPTTVPRETAKTMHPCHGIRGWPWHGVGGKIQISKFRGGRQTVLRDESLVSSVSRSVPAASSISALRRQGVDAIVRHVRERTGLCSECEHRRSWSCAIEGSNVARQDDPYRRRRGQEHASVW
jgi:hypothetical protein